MMIALGILGWVAAYCLLGWAAEKNFMVLPALFAVLVVFG